MPIGEFCNREVVYATRDMTVLQAAKLMREHHVGTLVVADDSNGVRKPVGIITDRDIVVEVVALELNPDAPKVSEIMGLDLVTARENEGVFETIQKMRAKGIRRIPIVDDRGALVGIVSIDDLLELLAEEMNELAKIMAREQAVEKQTRK